MLNLTFFLCREGELDDIIDWAGEPNGLRPVEKPVSALHTEVDENCGVDHRHLEATDPLSAKGGYVVWGTLVVTLRERKGTECV